MSVPSMGSTMSYVSDNSTLNSHYSSPDVLTDSSISTNPSTLEAPLPSIHAGLCAQENAQFIKNLPQLEVEKLLSPFRQGILESTSTLAVRDAITNEVKMIPGHQLIDVTKNAGMCAPSSHTYESVSSRAGDYDFILPRANSSGCLANKRTKLFGSLIIAGILLAAVLTVVLFLVFSGAENENPGNSATSSTHQSTGPHPHQTTTPSPHQIGSTPVTVTNATKDSNIIVIGGWASDAYSSMEMYYPFNPQLNHVLNVTMRELRWYHTSALIDDGTVITVGGWNDFTISYLSSCERFHPSTYAVTYCPSLLKARRSAASSVLNGVLYVRGGFDGLLVALQSCEQLSIHKSNVWHDSIHMTSRRYAFAMVTLDEYLYSIGGFDAFYTQDGDYSYALSSVERRFVTDRRWKAVQPMNNKRYHHSAAAMAGKIYTCGGRYTSDTCEVYDPTSNIWVEIARMNRNRWDLVLVSVGYNLLAVGGNDNQSNHTSIEIYKDSTWEIMLGKLIYERTRSSAVLIET